MQRLLTLYCPFYGHVIMIAVGISPWTTAHLKLVNAAILSNCHQDVMVLQSVMVCGYAVLDVLYTAK